MADTTVGLPDTIKIAQSMTPNEMRALKEHTGRPLTELLGGDPDDMEMAPDRIQSLVWIALRRAGYDVDWHEAGDVLPDMSDDVVDPTRTGSSNSSSISAGGGK